MKKLGIICALLLVCGTTFAANGAYTLVNNVTIGPMGTLKIPLNVLPLSTSYAVICRVVDPNNANNKVSIDVSFYSSAPVTVNYNMNTIPFSGSVVLPAEYNTLMAVGVENIDNQSVLNIENQDQHDSINAFVCQALPIPSSANK